MVSCTQNYRKPLLQRCATRQNKRLTPFPTLFCQNDSPNHGHGTFVGVQAHVVQGMALTITTKIRYAISSLISLFSLNAAFAIDAIRDIYEVRIRLWRDQTN